MRITKKLFCMSLFIFPLIVFVWKAVPLRSNCFQEEKEWCCEKVPELKVEITVPSVRSQAQVYYSRRAWQTFN